jgi:hypothetical protein
LGVPLKRASSLEQQLRCRDEYFLSPPTLRNRMGGPVLGMSDWLGEEILELAEHKAEQYELFRDVNRKALGEKIRTFESGATRDSDSGKLDYEGFLSPIVLHRYAQYMNHHRKQSDGSLRESNNWTKGIPRHQYTKSLFRHFMDVWNLIRGYTELSTTTDIEEALCACLFNCMGLLHECLHKRDIK